MACSDRVARYYSVEGGGVMHERIVISESLREGIYEHARREHPLECCGILIGSGTTVTEVVGTRNAAMERLHDRYVINPLDIVRVDRAAREKGWEIIGVYHSHPDHAAIPSETDREAAWEAFIYVIVSVGARGVGEMRAWELEGRAFREVPMASSA